jgi:hypothetical protein
MDSIARWNMKRPEFFFEIHFGHTSRVNGRANGRANPENP